MDRKDSFSPLPSPSEPIHKHRPLEISFHQPFPLGFSAAIRGTDSHPLKGVPKVLYCLEH